MTPLLPLIPGLPLAAFVLIVALLRRPSRLAGYLSILAIAGSFVVSVLVLLEAVASSIGGAVSSAAGVGAGGQGEGVPGWVLHGVVQWLRIGQATIDLSFFVDPLGAVMLVVVTLVSMLVQIYSLGYMVEHGHLDPGFSRFYAFLSLFTFSMLGLVLADNFVQLFVFWELVGLCSYLLVGFWYHKPEAADAAKKAFLTTRFGDLGFLIGILVLFAFTGTFAFDGVARTLEVVRLRPGTLELAMVLLFCGAIGKSAQFPLHVWLPDAMEGPTPVSALIHAATMVAAGVFMVARLFNLFSAAPGAMEVVAWIGGFTAIFAATHGLAMRDIKRVLAYSTVSQLGYMMLALGIGGLAAGVFHLTTHAFFKALLFLGSGSVIHGSGEQDMFKLGGLGRRMPITRSTFLVGALALAGVFPFAGFWSKDEILLEAANHGRAGLLAIGVVTAFLTAFYIFRAYFLTFAGEPRPDWVDPDERHAIDAAKFSIDVRRTDDPIARLAYEPYAYDLATHGAAADDGHAPGDAERPQPGSPLAEAVVGGDPDPTHRRRPTHGTEDTTVGHHERGPQHAHESPPVMTVPLIVLAVLAFGAGFVGLPTLGNPFATFLTGHPQEGAINLPLALGTTLLALLAIGMAWLMYGRVAFRHDPLVVWLGPLYTLFARRYYVDDLYNWLIAVFVLGAARLAAWFDRRVIDGVVNFIGWLTAALGELFSRAQTGRAPNYALVVFAGIVVIVAVLLTQPRMVP
ncbi:MAG TPA: NADH-quinone oxidoreductase subunit L [Chloroflexota bacterium]|jgi:proton-translocating NADH-quinone oxidoreductase chain L